MKQFSRPSFLVSLIGVLIVVAIITFVTLPLINELSASRKQIDFTRSTIATLEKQQQNIETVSREFSRLTEQDEQLDKLFLNEERSVEFFNSLDASFSANGINGQSVKFDPPQSVSKYQTLNVTVTFNAPYATLIRVVRELQSLEPVILVQSVAITERTGDASGVNITLNGLALWENS